MTFAMRRTWGPTPNYPLVMAYRHPSEACQFPIIAGPCSVENEYQMETIAREISKHGATHLRGGMFRAGTYPPRKNFGHIDVMMRMAVKDIATKYGMINVKEWVGMEDYSLPEGSFGRGYCIQIGARQMQNYEKLVKAGGSGLPVFLKRHHGSTLDEFLGAAEYILKAGCKELYLIERGGVTHLNHVRWDLSISMIAAIHAINPNLKVIVDASHGTGRRDLVEPMTLAGVAAGADGVLIETHPEPEKSLSDADQAWPLERFGELMSKINKVRGAR